MLTAFALNRELLKVDPLKARQSLRPFPMQRLPDGFLIIHS